MPITNINPLQPNGFKLTINKTAASNFEFFANTVDHPEVTISESTVSFRKTDLRLPGDKIIFGILNVNAIIDENLAVYEEMLTWSNKLVDDHVNPSEGPIEDQSTYDMTLSIFDNKNNIAKTIKYHAAFPTSLGSVSFTAITPETQILLPITFAYTKFTLI